MVKKMCCIMPIVGLICSMQLVHAESLKSVGAIVGSNGAGLEITFGVHSKLRVRGLLSGLSLNYEGTEEDIEYDIEASIVNLGAVLDWHPASNPFRFSLGLVSTEPELGLESIASNDNYDIGDSSYTGTVSLSGTASFNSMAPYLSIGWASNLNNAGFYFSGELGVAYIGEPTLQISASGEAANVDTPNQTFDIQTSSEFAADLEVERQNLEDELSSFKFWPIVAIGLGYRF